MKLCSALIRWGSALIAASMIGCGGPESNTGGGYAEGPASPAGTEAAPPADPARTGESGRSAADAAPGRDAEGDDSTADGAAAEPTVLFIGTSLTAGAGLPQHESYPLLIEQRIDDAGLGFDVVNAGVSGETSAGALARIDWLLRQPFDVVVLETGANDMLRGIDPSVTEQNIQAIIDRIREERPEASIVLAGMRALPNLGEAYADEFEAIYPRLAERNDLALVPFLLEDVGGRRELNQSDGVHPTAEGHRIIAATVWEVLEPVLMEEAAG